MTMVSDITTATSRESSPHKHYRKRSASFTRFQDASPCATSNSFSKEGDQFDFPLTTILIAPLTFLSFLLSLTWIDYRNRQWRSAQRANTGTYWLSIRPRSPSRFWNGDGEVLRKKHRKVIGMEVRDAFEIRGRVVAGICLIFVSGMMAGFLGLRLVLWRILG